MENLPDTTIYEDIMAHIKKLSPRECKAALLATGKMADIFCESEAFERLGKAGEIIRALMRQIISELHKSNQSDAVKIPA